MFVRFFCSPALDACKIFYEDPERRFPALKVYQSNKYSYSNQELRFASLEKRVILAQLNKLFGMSFIMKYHD